MGLVDRVLGRHPALERVDIYLPGTAEELDGLRSITMEQLPSGLRPLTRMGEPSQFV